mmetsp:Transcript_6426/g.20592  ORF Transcript_6426/g.20592 Transcript_6426/m.20592 type:complete len:234 (-) Transcript_6426:3181-3882(-)
MSPRVIFWASHPGHLAGGRIDWRTPRTRPPARAASRSRLKTSDPRSRVAALPTKINFFFARDSATLILFGSLRRSPSGFVDSAVECLAKERMTQAASRPWKRSIVDTSTSESNSASSAWMQRSCSRNGVSTTMSCGATPRRESSRTTAKTTFASAIFRVSPLPARAPPGASPGSAASGSTSRNDAGAAQAKRSHSGVEVEKPWIPSCVFPGCVGCSVSVARATVSEPQASLRA